MTSNTVTGAGILRKQFFTLICHYSCWEHSRLDSARKQGQCKSCDLAGKLQLTNMAQKENADCFRELRWHIYLPFSSFEKKNVPLWEAI